ncbi:MAG: hypothetical protein WC952_13775 [Desulfobulbaceae bacterium]
MPEKYRPKTPWEVASGRGRRDRHRRPGPSPSPMPAAEKLKHFLFALFVTAIVFLLFISYYSLYLNELKKGNEDVAIAVSPVLSGYAAQLRVFLPASSFLMTLRYEILLSNNSDHGVALLGYDLTSTISGIEVAYPQLRQGLYDSDGSAVAFPVMIGGGGKRRFVLRSAVILPVSERSFAGIEALARMEDGPDIGQIAALLAGEEGYRPDARQDFLLTWTTGRRNLFSRAFSVDNLLFRAAGADGSL